MKHPHPNRFDIRSFTYAVGRLVGGSVWDVNHLPHLRHSYPGQVNTGVVEGETINLQLTVRGIPKRRAIDKYGYQGRLRLGVRFVYGKVVVDYAAVPFLVGAFEDHLDAIYHLALQFAFPATA